VRAHTHTHSHTHTHTHNTATTRYPPAHKHVHAHVLFAPSLPPLQEYVEHDDQPEKVLVAGWAGLGYMADILQVWGALGGGQRGKSRG
jgi:hypothetical protein